jgi:hypothetical protein
MKLRTVYLILCILGVTLTYWQFVPWVVENGLNMSLFFHQLFANRISAFFGMDVFVSALALVVFLREEFAPSRRSPMVADFCAPVSRRFSCASHVSLYAGTQSARGRR